MEALEILRVLCVLPCWFGYGKPWFVLSVSPWGKVRVLRVMTEASFPATVLTVITVLIALYLPLQSPQKPIVLMKCLHCLCCCWWSPAELFSILWDALVEPECLLLATFLIILCLHLSLCLCFVCSAAFLFFPSLVSCVGLTCSPTKIEMQAAILHGNKLPLRQFQHVFLGQWKWDVLLIQNQYCSVLFQFW